MVSLLWREVVKGTGFSRVYLSVSVRVKERKCESESEF